jgi:hypothetical protein
LTVSAAGFLIGVAGLQHGVGEIAQGNVRAESLAILSWKGSDAYRILAGEPALTIVPNLLVTGVLAVAFSLAYLVWITAFVEHRRSGLILALLSLGMLLFGAGFSPPPIGLGLAFAATKVNAPLTWWRTRVSLGARRALASAWPWLLALDLLAWLLLFPGAVIVGAVVSPTVANPVPDAVVYGVIVSALVLLPLAIAAAMARDSLAEPERR